MLGTSRDHVLPPSPTPVLKSLKQHCRFTIKEEEVGGIVQFPVVVRGRVLTVGFTVAVAAAKSRR